MDVLLSIEDKNMTQEFVGILQKLDRLAKLKLVSSDEKTINLGASLGYYQPDIYYSPTTIREIPKFFASNKKWFWEDILSYFPLDLKVKVEIFEGELFIMEQPTLQHNDAKMEMGMAIAMFTKKNNIEGHFYFSPFDVILSDDNVAQPDCIWISKERFASNKSKEYLQAIPELLVEILEDDDFTSLKNEKSYLEYKRNTYENQGITEYWTIYPEEKKVCVEVLQDGKYQIYSQGTEKGLVKSFVLEGFGIEIENLLNY
jgi:Uma2 family endonuclease